MIVEWLPRAHDDLSSQLNWIAERNPWAAIDIGDTVIAAVTRLADHPAMGRAGRVVGTRELVVVGTPFVVVYRLETAAVLILRVLHGAQMWPRE